MAEVLLPMDEEELKKPPWSAAVGAITTSVGVVEGEVLTYVEEHGSTTLRRLIRELEWPAPFVTMTVGSLVRMGLVVAVQRDSEIHLELRAISARSQGAPSG